MSYVCSPAWSDRTEFVDFKLSDCYSKPPKLETGLGTISAGIPYTLLLRIEAIGFPTFGLLL